MDIETFNTITIIISVSALVINVIFYFTQFRQSVVQSRLTNSNEIINALFSSNILVSAIDKKRWNTLVDKTYRGSCADLSLTDKFYIDYQTYIDLFDREPCFILGGKSLSEPDHISGETLVEKFFGETPEFVEKLDLDISEIYTDGPFEGLGTSINNILNCMEYISQLTHKKIYDKNVILMRLGRFLEVSEHYIKILGAEKSYPYICKLNKKVNHAIWVELF